MNDSSGTEFVEINIYSEKSGGVIFCSIIDFALEYNAFLFTDEKVE